MARALLTANPNKFDIFSFVPFINDEDSAVDTCYDLGLIPNDKSALLVMESCVDAVTQDVTT